MSGDVSLHGGQQPVAARGTGQVAIGAPVMRIDGPLKVTGQARYAAEHPTPSLAHGVVVNSTIAKGRIERIAVEAALAAPGVIDVLTHLHRPKMRSMALFYKDMTAPGGSPFRPLYDAEISYSGQPVALVLAETLEAARYAAGLIEVAYTSEPHRTDLTEDIERAHSPSGFKAGYSPPPEPRGDADAELASAAVAIRESYHTATQHHNPMEMLATTVIRGADGHLTIYDKTQGSQNCRWVVSRAFGLSKDMVTVRNPFVGGAFGSGLRPQYPLLLAVMASLQLQRSVRVELSRPQMFTFGHRPETWQRVALGASSDGTLMALTHEATAETSRHEDYAEMVVGWGNQLYRCENVRFGYGLVALDQYTPLDMRAPGAAQGMFALEVAMDELACALQMDPVELRLKNYADRNPADDAPYSSKELRACYAEGAARFGWAQRSPEPRSMRDGHELVGWGMATGVWDALQLFARASAVLHADGRLVIASAASDIGTGTYTVMTQIAAASMGLPMEDVTFKLGDSTLPVAPVEGGSSHVTTIGSAVEGVCEKLQKRLFKIAAAWDGSAFGNTKFEAVEFADGNMRLRSSPSTHVALREIVTRSGEALLEERYLMLPKFLKQRKFARLTHSAVFCEVRVDEAFGTVRVTRVVSAIAAGKIINPLTARSQIIGGVVWGIGQALHEESQVDHNLGRFMNHSLGDYHFPVNADIEDIDVIFIGEEDRIVSRIGAKGVGEIGMVGVAAAVSNAIHHATGRRMRSLPMTPDKVMAPD